MSLQTELSPGALSGSLRRIYKRCRQAAARTAKSLLYVSGVYDVLRARRTPSSLAVAMFHRVLPEGHPHWRFDTGWSISEAVFAKSLDLLCRFYEPVSAQDVVNSLAGRNSLPSHGILFTFDDGWIDTLTVAGPILARRALPSVVFIPPAIFDSQGPFWQEILTYNLAIGQAGVAELDAILTSVTGHEPLSPAASSWDCLRRTIGILNNTPPSTRDAAIKAIVPTLRTDGARHFLSIEDLPRLAEFGIDVGAHGYSHNSLTSVSDPELELARSRAKLSDLMGREIRTMSAPHGRLSPLIAAQALAAGFEAIFTTSHMVNRLTDGKPKSRLLGRFIVSQDFHPGGCLHSLVTCDCGAINEDDLKP